MTSISEIDYPLLKACLEGAPGGWKDFVDRYLGLVLHTIDLTAQTGKISLTREERSDLCESVFRALHHNGKELLRNFTYSSSLSAYMVIIVRRIVIAFLNYTEK